MSVFPVPIIGIYKITSPSERVYIGQSWNIESRWEGYRAGHGKAQPLVHNSFGKYGVQNHYFEIVRQLSSDTPQSAMDYWEQFYMDLYRAEGYRLLNLRGAGSHGKWSDEWKRRRSRAMKGRKVSDAVKGAMSAAQTGRVHSPETRRRMSEARKRGHALRMLLTPPPIRSGKKPRVHLTALQVIQIRQRHVPLIKKGNKQLAEEFGVSVSTIERVTRTGKGASWASL